MELCFDPSVPVDTGTMVPTSITADGTSYLLTSGIRIYSKRCIHLSHLAQAFPFMICGNTGSYLDWLRKTGIPEGWEQFLSRSLQ